MRAPAEALMTEQEECPDPLIEGLERLEAMLIAARDANAGSSRDCREGVLAALNAVLVFIQGSPRLTSQNLGIPLAELSAALSDLDKGIVTDLFRPKTKNHRAGFDLMVNGGRAYCAVTMSILMDLGKSKTIAAKEVAKAIERHGSPRKGGKPISWKRVAAWRDAITSGLGTDFDTSTYREQLAQLGPELKEARNCSDADRERFARRFIQGLEEIIKRTRFPKSI
jgi:hypothetical protein